MSAGRSAWTSSWRATMRIARRDAQRAKGRTALVAVMIGLPVLLVSAVDVIARSAQDGPEQTVSRHLGDSAQALVTVAFPGTPVAQLPDQRWGQPLDSGPDAPLQAVDPADVVDQAGELLPAGSRLVPDVQHYGVRFRVGSGDGDRIVNADLRESAWADAGASGRLTVHDGRLPDGPDEVAITPALARHGDLAVGAELEHVDADGAESAVSVVGIAEESSGSANRTVLATPGALLTEAATQDGTAEVTYLVVGPDRVAWQDVLALNELGLTVLSRHVVLNPPPDSDVPYITAGLDGDSFGTDTAFIAAAVTAVGLTLLEVALLAGPAFAVGARRNRRQLALVAASGGDRRHVRNIVLAGGLVIGLGASVVGAGLGAALGVGLLPVIEHYELGDFAHTAILPLDLLALVAVGTLTAVAAAVVPAWQASNQDVVAALAGRRGQAAARRRVAVAGVVVAAAGAAMALMGASQRQPYLLVGGTALAELGLIATTGALIVVIARGARRLPMAPRLALRDAARQRGRTAPAVAAVMAAVAGSVAISLVVAAFDERDRQGHQAVAAHGRVVQDLVVYHNDGPVPGDATVVERALRAHLPIDETAVLHGPGSDAGTDYFVHATMPPRAECPLWVMDGQPSQQQIDAAEDDPRCEYREAYPNAQLGSSGLVVDDGSGLALALGDDDPAVEQALAAGLVVLYDPDVLWDDGTVHLSIEKALTEQEYAEGVEPGSPRTLVLPATLVSSSLPPSGVVMSPETAQEAGLATSPQYLVATTTTMPTDDEIEQASAALEDAGQNGYVQVERGYVSDYSIGLLALAVAAAVVTLGATGIAVGLAAADGRADLATLAAVGASPALRRRLAASQAAVVSVLGVGLGVIAGIVPGAAVVWMLGGGGFDNGPGTGFMHGWQYAVVPWANLLAIGVVVPVLAIACGYLFTRSRLPMVRRVGL